MPLGRIACVVATTVFWISISSATEVDSSVSVRVVDPTGAPIPRAEIQIGTSQDSLGPPLFADASGVFAADLGIGVYYVQASAIGFGRQIRRIEILPTSEADMSVRIGLNVGRYSGPAIQSFTAAEAGTTASSTLLEGAATPVR
ncbi:MAG TPA: carboxypeptidase-like regulatory domain-containing protein [Bryobacteraceae bacterium]|nr:carboxypeptidase-like regulatory domain-containing protein [Bryobacteraceae bacterium]